MSEHGPRAYVARIGRHDPSGRNRRLTLFYAVIAESQTAAMAAIRNAVESSDYVEMTDGRLSAETTAVLGMDPGVPKAM